MDYIKAIELAKKGESVKLRPGVYLQSGQTIYEDCKKVEEICFGESEDFKNIYKDDDSLYITTDNGIDPISVKTSKEIELILS